MILLNTFLEILSGGRPRRKTFEGICLPVTWQSKSYACCDWWNCCAGSDESKSAYYSLLSVEKLLMVEEDSKIFCPKSQSGVSYKRCSYKKSCHLQGNHAPASLTWIFFRYRLAVVNSTLSCNGCILTAWSVYQKVGSTPKRSSVSLKIVDMMDR